MVNLSTRRGSPNTSFLVSGLRLDESNELSGRRGTRDGFEEPDGVESLIRWAAQRQTRW